MHILLTTKEKKILKSSFTKEIKNILNNLGDGDISPSAYDTAWVSRVPAEGNKSKPMFPECLKWLQNNQLTDGSWGVPTIEYYHDRIICTLSCIVALKSWNISNDLIKKGEDYINRNLDNLQKDHHETLGFELVFMSLLEKSSKLGLQIDIEHEIINKYRKMRDFKLSKIPLEAVYRRKSSISFSLEFLDGSDVNINKLLIHQEKNGSIGCSPAATAFVLSHIENEQSREYINNILGKLNHTIPNVYTIDFEVIWSLDNLINLDMVKDFRTETDKLAKRLDSTWQDGLAFSRYFSTKDLDDTALGFKVLNYFGYNKDFSVFNKFKTDNGFVCYKGEKEGGPSHLANFIHSIEKTQTQDIDSYLKSAYDQLLTYTLDDFYDKWHISPFYTISRLIFDLPIDYFDNIIKWIFNKQNSEGSWGYKQGNSLETAYVLNFLLKNIELLDKYQEEIEKALDFMFKTWNLESSPYLWMGKSVYSPVLLDRLTILNILYFALTKFT